MVIGYVNYSVYRSFLYDGETVAKAIKESGLSLKYKKDKIRIFKSKSKALKHSYAEIDGDYGTFKIFEKNENVYIKRVSSKFKKCHLMSRAKFQKEFPKIYEKALKRNEKE